jgi:uncharacterized protein YndB with AHSA1/START domain
MSAVQAVDASVRSFSITKDRSIAAPIEIVWESVIEELIGITGEKGDGMNFKLELRPGGRWYRDLGNDTGHLWGHVQVVKPPKLLEIAGPMMMSYPVASHVQYRLTANDDGTTKLAFNHSGVGLIRDRDVTGMTEGWGMIADRIEKRAVASKKS